MVLNPQVLPSGMLGPFVNEIFVLARDGRKFKVEKISRTVLQKLLR
ncbi:unnamed protein product [Coffea canephora]|uniref:Uncharacterized protein n=1 Tax=Coffea canephora TaxID=49390 RepID=A0A068USY8_COFCA|nr:unnamed protein product [Coffea canephora]